MWEMCREELWARVTCFCLLAVTELSQRALPTWQVSHRADSTSSYSFINVWMLLWGVGDVMVRARCEIDHAAVPSWSLSGLFAHGTIATDWFDPCTSIRICTLWYSKTALNMRKEICLCLPQGFSGLFRQIPEQTAKCTVISLLWTIHLCIFKKKKTY